MNQVFLFLENTNKPNKKRITSYHYALDLLTLEEKKLGILVDEVPQPEMIPNKRFELFYNTETQTLFYEYYDVELPPLSQEQINKELQSELASVKIENQNLKLSLAESAEAQQQDKIQNQLAIAELVETLTTKGVL